MKNKVIPIAVLAIAFITSVVFYINGNKYKTLRFKFYHELSDATVIEERNILISEGNTNWPRRVVDEIFLGPISVFNKKLTTFGLKPNSFFVKGNAAYLDLPIEFVLDNEQYSNSVRERLKLIEENILMNTWKINSVYITIEGELPNYDYEILENSEENLSNKK